MRPIKSRAKSDDAAVWAKVAISVLLLLPSESASPERLFRRLVSGTRSPQTGRVSPPQSALPPSSGDWAQLETARAHSCEALSMLPSWVCGQHRVFRNAVGAHGRRHLSVVNLSDSRCRSSCFESTSAHIQTKGVEVQRGESRARKRTTSNGAAACGRISLRLGTLQKE